MTATVPCTRCGAPKTPEARFCQRCGTSFAAVSDPMLGEVLLGRYRVTKLLGEGTMGRVYLGEQRVGEAIRNVAIKVLAAARGNDDYIVARFRREASTIASLEHPNIIKLFDYGEEGGRFLSVMEYVPGGSLAALIAHGPLPLARVEAIAWQIAGALDEAHKRGVVHRDLKPENVLVASSREAGGAADVVKVVDFGIARRPPSSPGERPLTITGAMLGTPAFMAPEQFRGEAADATADVYALALVVYQMLSGVLPWNATTVMEWGEAHMFQAPRPLRTQPGCVDLPERADAAIARALAKDPRQRTASALDFVRALTGSAQPGVAAPSIAPAVVPGALPHSVDLPAPGVVRSSRPPPRRAPRRRSALAAAAALIIPRLVGSHTELDASAPADAASPVKPSPDARIADAGRDVITDAGAARGRTEPAPAPTRRTQRAHSSASRNHSRTQHAP
ncbi:MAG: serine/threonine-protein kinase [Polyangiales bacterium]